MAHDEQPEPRWRLFIAAPMPLASANELFDKLADLRRRFPDVRWAKVDQLHATLVFLGQTAATDVDRLTAAISAASKDYAAIEADTAESGGRAHDRRDGVAWLRLRRGAAEMAALSVAIDRLVGSNQYANSVPRPHITVARRVDQRFLNELRAAAMNSRTEWVFDRVCVYRSHSQPGGSRYETIATALLTPVEASA